MKYVLQTLNGGIQDLDVFTFEFILKQCHFQHSFIHADIKDVSEPKYAGYIPIGSIQFIARWLECHRGVDKMNPIEVPACLRKEKYLGREYRIVRGDKLPESGSFFVKDVSALKAMSFSGDIENLHRSHIVKSENLYQVSSLVDIEAEYRAFVDGMNIAAICLYNGDCKTFPDAKLLQEMVDVYTASNEAPLSYTMDVAILKNGRTVIMEIHPVTSVGLYGYGSRNLAYMYKEGIDYYIEKNHPLKESA